MKIKICLPMFFVFVFIMGQHILSYGQVPVISGGNGAPAGSGGYNNAGLPATGLGCGGGGGSWWGGTGGAGLFGGGGGGAGGYYSYTVNWSGGDGGQGVVIIAYYDGSNNLLSSELKISGSSTTVPAGVSSAKVWAIGGGGGGGGATQNDGTSGGGGGAGGVAYIYRSVLPGDIITYSIGNGGKGGHGSIAATSGGTTTATIAGITISGFGGNPGLFNNATNSAGGSYSGGDGGANGGYGEGSSGDIGGGGGGAIGGGNPANNGTEGGTGANAVDVSGLFAACNIASLPVTPAIASFTPSSGLAGTVVTIYGNGFSGTSNVRFGGIAASSYNIVSDGEITATVASGTVTGSVTVELTNVTLSKPLYQYITPPVPSISSFSPSSGGTGTVVNIYGNNFIGVTSVKFGGSEAYSFSVITNSQITAVVSTGSSGQISVTSSGGSANSASSFTFSGQTYISWTGATSTDWSTPGNWDSNTIPTQNTDVNVPLGTTFSPVVTSTASTKNLTVHSGAEFTVNSGASLITTGTVTGEITIQKTVTGSTDLEANSYHLVAVPLHPDNNSLSELFLGSYLYGYDPAENEWSPLGTSTSVSLDETLGYMIFYPDASTTYTFTGQPNTGTFAPTVTYAGNSGGNNFALVPNPYPSNIDWNAASGWTKTNIGNTIWIYNNGNYATWNGTSGTNGGSRYIAAGQAFFVQTTAAVPSLVMDNGVRTHTSATFLKNTTNPENQLRIRALANGMQDEILTGFADGTSVGFNPMEDALKLFGAGNAPQLYTLAGDSKVSINQLAELNGSAEVPLFFETEYIGEVTLEFSQIENFPNELKIRLEDKLTGQWVNLREISQYIFTHNPTNTADRFVLHFGSPAGIEDAGNHNISSWVSGNTFYLSTPEYAGEKAKVEVFSISGQLLYSRELTLSNLQQFNLNAKGAVITRVTLNNQVLNTKAVAL